MNDLESLDGLYVGQLDAYEMWLFKHAVSDGLAEMSYEGPGGWLGMAKVRLCRKVNYPNTDKCR